MSNGKTSNKKFNETQTLNKLNGIPEEKKSAMVIALAEALKEKTKKTN